MSSLSPIELIRINKRIDEGNYEVALKLIKNFEEREDHTPQDHLICELLKCEILFQQGLYEDLLNITEQAYKDSLELGLSPLSLDLLMWKARALMYLFKVDDVLNIISEGEKHLENLKQELPSEYKQREATIAFVKGLFYFWENRDVDLAVEQLTHSLALREKYGTKPEIILTNMQIAKVLIYGKGEFHEGAKYLEDGMTLAKELKNKYNIAWGLLIMGVSLAFKGEIDQSIQVYEQSLALFRELSNEYMVANALNNLGDSFKMKGDLDQALKFAKERLALRSDSGSIREIAVSHDALIQISIQKGDLEQAQKYLDDMGQLVINLKEKHMNRWYLLDKAMVLKESSIARKRLKAEEILRQIIKEEEANYELSVYALLNLCDLLLTELEIANIAEILEEVEPLISKLLEIAEQSHSYWIWGETFFLQAKLALISLKLKEARRFLTQGQKIAEKYGLDSLALKISHEHDELLRQLNLWENMKESEPSISERMKLARLNEQIEHMVKRRAFEVPESLDEMPVLLLVTSEGGMPLFSQSFIKDKFIEDHLFGGFFTTINSFVHDKFSEGLDRASFGKYTLLMNSVSPLIICYVYKGQSYSAQKRIKSFIDELKSNKEIWDKFEKFYQANRKIQIKDIPSLEPLIKEIFIEKTY